MTAEKRDTKNFDLKDVIQEKSPKLAKWLPGFALRYLKKVAHEDIIDELINKYGHLEGFDFSKAMLERFNISLVVKGEENIPKDGKFIFVSNHPLGGYDGHIIMVLVGERFREYKFLVNDILMNLKNMHKVFIPVNKHGRQGAGLAQQIDEAYQSDAQILTFPAGLVSRKIDGKIIDLKWQKNFIVKAKQHERDIIPIHLSGQNSNFFYRLGNIRKTLGIKANIEMLYLIDEQIKNQNKEFTVTFGKPIAWQTFDKSKRPAEWAAYVKDIVYDLDRNN